MHTVLEHGTIYFFLLLCLIHTLKQWSAMPEGTEYGRKRTEDILKISVLKTGQMRQSVSKIPSWQYEGLSLHANIHVKAQHGGHVCDPRVEGIEVRKNR